MSDTLEFRIIGMDCADCAFTLERGIAQLEGIESVQVHFATAMLHATGDVQPEIVAERVRALGYDIASPAQTDLPTHLPLQHPGGVKGFFYYLLASRATVQVSVAALLLIASALLSPLLVGRAGLWAVGGMRLVAIGLAGYPIARKGVRSLLIARQVTIDLLMTVATVGALVIGEMGEAATVVLLFAVGEALEGYTAERARDSLRGLLSLAPMQATVLRPCIDCAEHLGQDGYKGGPCPWCEVHESTVAIDQVLVGDRVVVRPGERIPVDGQVISGASSVNQAPITGESVPVAKLPGAEVYAGTVNGEGVLEIEVTRLASDSTICRIVKLVEQAQAQRSSTERSIDRFARWYTPAVVLAAFLVAVVPPLFFGQPFVDVAHPQRGWLYRAFAMLIVACPCALVISTPVTVASALAGLAQRGILVKSGAILDALARVKNFAFDKTGTLTKGQPTVVRTMTLDCLQGETSCAACDDLLALAASVERRSAHPLARAVVVEAESRSLSHRYSSAEAIEAVAGRGLQGRVNGLTVMVGSHVLFHEGKVECKGLHEQVDAAEAQGQTVIMVGKDGTLQGFIGLSDTLRPASRAVLRAIKAVDSSARIIMLTGDNSRVAQAVAAELGSVDEVRSNLLPEDKVEAVRALQDAYGPVAMVGDGINDAPALALASVGIAMGGAGTAQAMETADVVLMQDDLMCLLDALTTSRRARHIIGQNIAFSLVIKGLFLLLTLPGLATMWMAVFADMGASLLVTLNGMRMLQAPPLDQSR